MFLIGISFLLTQPTYVIDATTHPQANANANSSRLKTTQAMQKNLHHYARSLVATLLPTNS
jgi:hypothetical protein